MTTKDNGGPAFPHGNPTDGGEPGMTLRDYFAAAALVNRYTHRADIPAAIAQWAYEVADAMLEERK